MAVFYKCDYIFACCFLSALVSLWCLKYLWQVRHVSWKRLFWRQLVILALIDVIYCSYTVGFRVAWGLMGREVTQKMMFCHSLMPVRVFCEQLSCFLEVHIAMGFAFACHGCTQVVDRLLLTVPLLFVVTGVWLSFAMQMVVPPNWGCDTGMEAFAIWGQTVLASCVLTVLFYFACLLRRGTPSPWVVKRRVVLRILSFLLSFLITIGGRAFCVLFYTNETLEIITEALLGLNGVAIMGTYMFWMLRRASLEEQQQEDALQLSTIEALIIDRHFDLAFEEDEAVAMASRNVSEAVLLASCLRQDSTASRLCAADIPPPRFNADLPKMDSNPDCLPRIKASDDTLSTHQGNDPWGSQLTLASDQHG